jgi:2-haloacid dehalogenase
VSSNPFDIIGARFVGWNAAWVQRDKKIVFDLLDVRFGLVPADRQMAFG